MEETIEWIAANIFFKYFSIFATIFFLLLLEIARRHQPYFMPPGPLSLSFVGYLPLLFYKQPEKKLFQLQRQHGRVIRFFMGSQIVIAVQDFMEIKEALSKYDDFNSRPKLVARILPDSEMPSEHQWQIHRNIIVQLHTKRQTGPKYEAKQQAEVIKFMQALEGRNEKSFDPHSILLMSVANNILEMQCGKRFAYTDNKFKQFCEDIYEYAKYLSPITVRNWFPWMYKIPILNRLILPSRLNQIKKSVSSFYETIIKEQENSYEDGSYDTYIQAFLTEINKTNRRKSINASERDMLQNNLFELMSAGTNATQATLRCIILLLTANPNCQKKLQAEIDEKIGRHRMPSIQDIPQMLYAQAVIMEAQRYGSIIPLNPLHCNDKYSSLYGYHLPKDTMLLCNLWALHHNRKTWEKPELFMPERFIKHERLEKPAYQIPFSIGKRSCPGENVAISEMFLYVTALLQKYTIKCQDIPTTFENHGIMNVPKPFTMQLISR